MNPNITMEIIEKYPNKLWSLCDISCNPNITMEIIEKYPNKLWSWYGISRNPNITMEIIEKYPNKPWDWYWISQNPNITMEFIDKNIYNMCFRKLSNNNFTYHNKLVKIQERCKNIFYLQKMKRISQDIQRSIITNFL